MSYHARFFLSQRAQIIPKPKKHQETMPTRKRNTHIGHDMGFTWSLINLIFQALIPTVIPPFRQQMPKYAKHTRINQRVNQKSRKATLSISPKGSATAEANISKPSRMMPSYSIANNLRGNGQYTLLCPAFGVLSVRNVKFLICQ